MTCCREVVNIGVYAKERQRDSECEVVRLRTRDFAGGGTRSDPVVGVYAKMLWSSREVGVEVLAMSDREERGGNVRQRQNALGACVFTRRNGSGGKD